jgi:tetratricopeptide (TPR) repeat protein
LLRRFSAAEAALNRSLEIREQLQDAVGKRNTLRSLGLLRWHEGRNQDALVLVERALDIDRARGDQEAVLGDLSNMGHVLKGMGEYERARDCLEEALRLSDVIAAGDGSEARPAFAELAASGADRRGTLKLSYVLHNLANVHRELRDNERALAYLREASRIAGASRLPIQNSYHLTAIAHILLQEGEIEESLALYREAVEQTRKARFVPGLAQALRVLGEIQAGLGAREEALSALLEAAALIAQLEDRATEAYVWSRIAALHEGSGRNVEAMAAWGKVRSLCESAADARGELAAVEGLARVTRLHVAEPTLALGYYREALALATSIADEETEGRVRNIIGILEWSRGRYDAALEQYEAACALFRRRGERAAAGLMLNSIGVTLLALGRRAQARARLEEAIAEHHAHAHARLEGHARAVLGDLFRDAGETERALDCYESSLRLRRQIGDREGAGWMLQRLARTELARGLTEVAHTHAAEAERLAAECGSAELQQACEHLRRAPML